MAIPKKVLVLSEAASSWGIYGPINIHYQPPRPIFLTLPDGTTPQLSPDRTVWWHVVSPIPAEFGGNDHTYPRIAEIAATSGGTVTVSKGGKTGLLSPADFQFYGSPVLAKLPASGKFPSAGGSKGLFGGNPWPDLRSWLDKQDKGNFMLILAVAVAAFLWGRR